MTKTCSSDDATKKDFCHYKLTNLLLLFKWTFINRATAHRIVLQYINLALTYCYIVLANVNVTSICLPQLY